MEELPFGRLVRERRRALDLTQEELARRVACAAITVRKIEAGALRPSLQVAERLAQALAIPLDDRAAFIRAARQPPGDGGEPPATPPSPALVPEEIGLADLSGRAIRGYQLGERLGSGGFGAVYRAMQPQVEREVAVKIILPRFADQPEFIRRFEAEAQFVARLEHPHIVPLYDYWREPGVAYLVMRLLRGGTLHALLQQGPLTLERVAKVVEQIGNALQAAHRAGVVHRDLKPANVLLDEEGNAYLADFGIAKDLQRPVEASFAGAFVGSPAYSSPEQIRAELVTAQTDIYALGLLLYELLTGQKPFPGPTPASFLEQHLNANVPTLATHRPGLPSALDRAVRRATAKVPAARYGSVAELLAEVRTALAVAPPSVAPHAEPAAVAAPPTQVLDLTDADNPYQGLRPFDEAVAAAFFGRETFIQLLLTRLGEGGDLGRFLAVVGPSGSGKSSTVRAGLIPALRSGGLPGSEQWYIVTVVPGAQPLYELATALRRVAPGGIESDDLLTLLRADTRGLLRAARLVLPADPAVELVLLIDQFEELFTLSDDEPLRSHLIESIVTAVLDPHSRLRVVVTLRADFIDRPLQYVDLGELLRQRSELVLPLTPDELERAIVEPARRAGLTLEDGLAAVLARDVASQPGVLPLLQHSLSELFTRRRGRVLTRAAYHEIGGVAGALAHSAERLVSGFDTERRALVRQIFLRLTTPGDGADDTRRRAALAELQALGDTADTVIATFGTARFLTFDHDPLSRAPTVEVAHEALLREWPRLRGWLDAARTELRLQRRLAQEAAEWETADRADDYLASGARLNQYEALSQGETIALTRPERDFLNMSLAQRDQQAIAERERQARELAQAQALAEEQQQRAEAQRRAAQGLRILVGALTIFLLVAAGLAAFAVGQQREAENQARQANVRAWSAAALNNLDVHPERSLLLSLHAAQETYARDGTPMPEAEDALRRSLQAAHLRHRLDFPESIDIWATWSNDGQHIAVQSAAAVGTKGVGVYDAALESATFTAQSPPGGGTYISVSPDNRLIAAHARIIWPDPSPEATQLFDVQSGQPGRTFPIYNPIFSADGTQVTGFLATAPLEGNEFIATYDVSSGEQMGLTELPIVIAETRFALLSPDGARCVEVLWSNDLAIFDTQTGVELYRLPDELGGVINVVAFSPDRRYLAVARETGVIEIYAVEQEDAVRKMQTIVSGGSVYVLAFSPDSRLLATDSDRLITIWEIATGRSYLTLPGHTARLRTLSFHPNGRELLSSDESGDVRVWDALPNRELTTYVPASEIFVLNAQRTQLLSTDYDQKARLWDSNSPDTLRELVGHQAITWGAAWSRDSQIVATGAEDGSVFIWDAATAAQQASLIGHSGEVWTLEFSADGSYLASGSQDTTARIWNVANGEELWRFDNVQPVNVVRFSSDERYLYAGLSQTGEITIWDTASGQLVETWQAHRKSIFEIVYSPDNRRIATASRDGEARIWDATSRELLLTLRGHAGDVRGLDWSPDGSRIATASYDATVRLWDAQTGELLKTIPADDGAHKIAFSADSKRLFVSTTLGNITIFTLDPAELIALGQQRLTRTWTPEECRQYLQTDVCPKEP